MEASIYRKIIVPESHFRCPAFADFCSYRPEGSPEKPLIIYIGGSIGREEYEKRQTSKPEAIIVEFEKALAKTAAKAIDLLIISPPVFDSRIKPTTRKNFLGFLVFDLLPLTSNPRPEVLGCVGFSLGGFFGACLTFDLPGMKAFAALGGRGMAQAAWDSPDASFAGKKFKSFGTGDDPMAMENYKFLHSLVAKGIDMDVEVAAGGHSFEDYVAAGFVEQAFSFVIHAVSGQPHLPP